MNKALKVFTGSVLVILVVTLIYLGVKGYQAKNGLKTGIADFKPHLQLSQLTDVNSLRFVPATVTARIQNFTNNTYTLSQAMVEIYTPDGVLIAEQNIPLSENTDIQPDGITLLPLGFELSSREAISYFTKGINLGDIIRFATGGKLGKELHIKGFVRAEGFRIKLDEKVTV